MSREQIITSLKVFIWACFGIILFAPLYINSHLFFPYITSKTFAFNIAVELVAVAFLMLCAVSHEYRIKMTSVIGLLSVYIGIIFVSSLLGGNFYHSFWSNHERSEGIVLLLHLLVFITVMTGFFKTMKDWLCAFDLAFLSSLFVTLVALGQWLQQKFPGSFDFVLKSSTGARLDATIGNPGYVAGYLIFGVFFALLLITRRTQWQWRLYYVLGIALELLIIMFTQTRGAYLAVLFSLPLFAIFYFFFFLRDAKSRLIGGSAIAIFCVIILTLFLYKDNPVIQNNKVLGRLTSISLTESTAKNRLLVWQNAWEGFKEKPVLGWGYENFYIPFNKHYNAELTEPWFDRSHNMIFDRLLTGGVVGLISYLALLLVPYHLLWRTYGAKKDVLRDAYCSIPVVLTVAIGAYVIQNLFIFEALVTYIPLCLLLAFVATLGPTRDNKIVEDQTFKTASMVAAIVLLIPIMYFVNLKPLDANAGLITIFSDSTMTVPQRLESFQNVIGRKTYGASEFRQQFYQYFDSLARQQMPVQLINPWVSSVGQELETEIHDNPTNLQAMLSLMSFYNMIGGSQPQSFQRNLQLFDQAVALSPGRPQTYQTIGYMYFYQSTLITDKKNATQQQRLVDLSLEKMHYAISLNPKNLDSYRHALTVAIYSGRQQEVFDLLTQADQSKEAGATITSLVAHAYQVAQSASSTELMEKITERYK